ncbi:MAG: F0F1 ATP synthase subunit B [Salibaculum sp.]|uniref:F0F1 ATP synthase subunit B n=1 Tax=Salibaculum sp. TaxID=2855480 RepID=UPI00286FFB2C|nr:F0F1 ATP synthase subunit B [Salibaculum sp.]MDR9426686.1 F0F1 ATP synthase subunit B [Salibaculum sp.]MDR9481673.1 F0F1 ATP synthase subunit B [Salibaculum sp.]
MNRLIATSALALAGSPALAASGEYGFFSLNNTDFIVLLGFIVFIGVLIYFKVPGRLSKMLDDRAAGIQSELDEAKALREEAQTLLASYERKQKEVQAQADRIIETAREEAKTSANQAKEDIKASVARRLAAAEEQIESAKDAALRDVQAQAVDVAISAARDVIAKQTDADSANKRIDDSIAEVGAKLH